MVRQIILQIVMSGIEDGVLWDIGVQNVPLLTPSVTTTVISHAFASTIRLADL